MYRKESMSQIKNYKYDLLLKEIDLIDGTIKNLDDIIYKTKNYAFLFWSGSIFLVTGMDKFQDNKISLLIILTAIIPIMFWTMNYFWYKHLRFTSQRERIISLFINSLEFKDWLENENSAVKFPLYDKIGWIYTTEMENKKYFDEKYLINRKQIKFWQIFFYKDAKVYYPAMVSISILFGYLY